MGKPTGKKKKGSGGKLIKSNSKSGRPTEQHSPKVFDEDTTMFMDMAQDMKEEGNKLFQRRDYDGALLKYEKAIKLLPKNHIDAAYLRSNIAACYMHMGPGEHHLAINECNLALEISPKYTKALLKRARCYEALNRLNLACRDVDLVLSLEPNNLTALEISERVKVAMEKRGLMFDEKVISLPAVKVVREKTKKKKSHKSEEKVAIKEAVEKADVKEAVEKVAVKESEEKAAVKEAGEKATAKEAGEKAAAKEAGAKAVVKEDGAKATVKEAVPKASVKEAVPKASVKEAGAKAAVKEAGAKAAVKEAVAQAAVKEAGAKASGKEAGAKAAVKEAGAKVAVKEAGAKVAVKEAGEKAAVKDSGGKAAVKEAGEKAAVKEAGEKAAVKEAGEKAAVKEAEEKAAVKEAGEKAAVKEAEEKAAIKEAEENVAVKEEKKNQVKEDPSKVVKFIFGEDIRCAQLPNKCSILQLREIVGNKFPSLRSILIKYKDKEGDLVTITTSEELRWAEESSEPQGSLRLYITEVNPEHEPLFEETKSNSSMRVDSNPNNSISEYDSMRFDDEKGSCTYIDDYILQFARLFKNHLGVDSDGYLNLHELGMKLYSEALEDTITSEEAQEIFDLTEDKFQEMAALALFNWGNVHMSRARKKMSLSDRSSNESILDQAKVAYEKAKAEYVKAGKKYEEALKIKPDFFEAVLALGQQQFEQAKLSWCYAIGSKADLATWPSKEVFELFNSAEDNIERGKEMWDEMEERRLKRLPKPNDEKFLLQKMGLDDYFIELSADEVAEHSSNMRSQINILWGTMLYERSVVEFKLGVPVWEDCLMAAVEKFKQAGASLSDISVMIKNHCANETAQQGLSFRIDEIVQAWNEMYDAKRWIDGVSSFRLEPLFRRQIPKLHDMLENI